MKKFIVVAAQLGSGKFGEGRLFLTNAEGQTIKVSAKFAAANGIDVNYRGAILYKSEHHAKGDSYEFTDAKGVVSTGVYENDFERITQILPADMSAMKGSAELSILDSKKAQLAKLLAD